MKTSSLKLIATAALSLTLTGFSACVSTSNRAPSADTSNAGLAPQAMNGKELDQPAACPSGQFSKRVGYSICFNNTHKQAIWVSYELTRDHLDHPVTSRTDDFTADQEFNSAQPTDFYGTIYERGHLAPSADMKWSQQAQEESFSMANMTPQTHAMNHGRWKDLEDQVRNWARKFGRVYIVMGPMLDDSLPKVGNSGVSVPKAHFKCVLALGNQTAVTGESGTKSICFIIPQEPTQPLTAYIHTVNEVEEATGLDLFAALDDSIEEKVESTASLDEWMHGLSMKPFLNSSRPQKAPQNSRNRSNALNAEVGSSEPAPQKSAATSAEAFKCAPKTCKQIQSCAEAKFLLNECGLKRLDSNGDGVPCEALCR